MMNRDELLELLTTEDVTKVMMELGSDYPTPDNHGNLYFTTVCHGRNISQTAVLQRQ